MREYAQVSPLFWTRGSGKKLRGKPIAQVIALHFVTCPAANMIGIYYQSLVTIAHETGLSVDDVRKGIAECSEVDFAYYDEEAELAWVPNMAAYQIGEHLKPGDLRRKRILAELAKADDHRFASQFRALYEGAYGLVKSPFNAPSKGIERCEEEQEQEQEQEHSPLIGVESVSGETEKPAKRSEVTQAQLEALYDRYPRKAGKAEGIRRLKTAVKTLEQYRAVEAGLTRFVEEHRRTDTKYIPHFSTWVNQRRWEDQGLLSPQEPSARKPSLVEQIRAREQASEEKSA